MTGPGFEWPIEELMLAVRYGRGRLLTDAELQRVAEHTATLPGLAGKTLAAKVERELQRRAG